MMPVTLGITEDLIADLLRLPPSTEMLVPEDPVFENLVGLFKLFI